MQHVAGPAHVALGEREDAGLSVRDVHQVDLMCTARVHVTRCGYWGARKSIMNPHRIPTERGITEQDVDLPPVHTGTHLPW